MLNSYNLRQKAGLNLPLKTLKIRQQIPFTYRLEVYLPKLSRAAANLGKACSCTGMF